MTNRRLALFLDGTWNTVNDDTNVWRLKALCSANSDQLVFYSAGVGTQLGERAIGGMFGYGLDAEVISAYLWLVENYRDGDKIFLFGFSRGAFTARALSGFISKCGLLKPGAPISLKQLYARYRKGASEQTIRGLLNANESELSTEDRWLRKYAKAIPIWFQGVWDTVGALGIPLGEVPLVSRSNYSFLETDLRINNSHAYHAVAIDEHRKAFAPTFWTRTIPKDAKAEDVYPPRALSAVEQRWFVGAHADVGGGYDNGLLAQVPLKWLMQKAESHGLLFTDTVELDGDICQGEIHDSFASMAFGLYRATKLWQRYFRPIGPSPVETETTVTTRINETIDESVFERWRRDEKYRPQNLVQWGKYYGVDIREIRQSVLANDPRTAAQ
jgi:uncharacterized protein (DUF2235 family)